MIDFEIEMKYALKEQGKMTKTGGRQGGGVGRGSETFIYRVTKVKTQITFYSVRSKLFSLFSHSPSIFLSRSL